MNHTNERMRRPIVWISILGALVIVAAAVVTITSTSDEPGSDGDAANPESAAVDYDQALAGAPAPLAKLYAQGDALIPGGADAYEAELAKLRGHPVVVNKWASWCGPCRYEFPFFQSQAAQQGKRIAFLGVDTEDSEDAARTFLDELPRPLPERERSRQGGRQAHRRLRDVPVDRLLLARGGAAATRSTAATRPRPSSRPTSSATSASHAQVRRTVVVRLRAPAARRARVRPDRTARPRCPRSISRRRSTRRPRNGSARRSTTRPTTTRRWRSSGSTRRAGSTSSMREIVKDIIDAPMPVVVYVSPNGARAASAGVFITEAADVAAMAPQTNIGSASAVTSSGGDIGGTLGEKIENDAAAFIRALAETHGRDGELRRADGHRRRERDRTGGPRREGLIDLISPDRGRAAAPSSTASGSRARRRRRSTPRA